LSVVAKRTNPLAWWELEIQALVPFKTKLSPSLCAIADAAPASLPFPGSDKQKAPIFSPVLTEYKGLSTS
jgi:hypothetical protein